MVHSCPKEDRVETRHSTGKLTYDDLLALPDDLLRHEIVDGVHFVTPAPATRHQRISRELRPIWWWKFLHRVRSAGT